MPLSYVPEKRLEMIEVTIMTMQGDFQVMHIILICDGSFLSINLELSGRALTPRVIRAKA